MTILKDGATKKSIGTQFCKEVIDAAEMERHIVGEEKGEDSSSLPSLSAQQSSESSGVVRTDIEMEEAKQSFSSDDLSLGEITSTNSKDNSNLGNESNKDMAVIATTAERQ